MVFFFFFLGLQSPGGKIGDPSPGGKIGDRLAHGDIVVTKNGECMIIVVHDVNKFIFKEMIMKYDLYKTNMLSWMVIVR